METCLYLELDLPLTSVLGLEADVGMPSFNAPLCDADNQGNQYSHFEAHYASQVALHSLCVNLHNTIRECESLKQL